ncbi:type I inositol polyphosphate 5-phosphatase 4 isoform X2 [Impatiens glandulifera]|uniref:type I inositol polyphosphate 5-phosphatase 4 isoform X2 n=1 Tax=Impatiens glandulifera TaxID=253017 RepID=UPI001FB18B3A|nr:type I inositol polyphosphate 5-phosphatase 4 isoform X2 [Impatiens glandulifera]
MRDDNCKKSKLSWSKTLVKKWFNIKSKAEDFNSDDVVYPGGGDEEWRQNFSVERDAACATIKKSKTGRRTTSRKNIDRARRSKIDLESSQITDIHNHRVFVATWNVAGKSPPSNLNLDDWLHASPPADIYVLGFQEIVPLNAGNVLGTEDNGPARKWVALIRKTLNSLPGTSGDYRTPSPVPDPVVELDSDFEGGSTRENPPNFFHRRSFHSLSRSMRMSDNDVMYVQPQPRLDRRFSVCDRGSRGHTTGEYYERNCRWESSDDENGLEDSPDPPSYRWSNSNSMSERDGQSRYCLVASKQMVGIFLTVWVKRDLRDYVRNMKVSCVGRGLMGYLGNKGSISISMSLHQTSFCFVCSHLTSGQKEGDELRRNADVMEILRKTRFPRVHGVGDENAPQTILDHDRVIWLGDLNYRIALSYRYAKALVEMRDWRALLENDQLQIEQSYGRVFEDWKEGQIYFPPTYKYSNNSDQYAGDDLHPKQKRRTPAWCDRILWYGSGLRQISYVRGESRFSDHRPVYSVFLVEVESINRNRIKKSMSTTSSRIEVEELLPYSNTYGSYNGLNYY